MYKQIKKVSVDEMNELLDSLKKDDGRIFIFREPNKGETISRFKVFLYSKITKVYLTFKELKHKRVIEYQTHLDKEFDGVRHTGTDALRILSQYWKAPEVNTKDTAPFSIGVVPYRNPKFIGKRTHNCYGYDLNSAYPYGMLQELPDTTQKLKPGTVKEGEYSFTLNGNRAKVGTISMFRFKAMKSPYEKFIDVWYGKKKNASDKKVRNDIKFVLNAAIGALQNHNCFVRAAIINNFHNVILDLQKKYKSHILSINTDSIVSDIKIPEIEENMGDEIGQWKLEHQGDFAIHTNGFSTQWNNDKPAFGAGISKEWFDKEYDILRDPLPMEKNIYEVDMKNVKIIRREGL